MRTAFLYDMRRSMLDRKVLMLLVILIAAGLGLGYLVSRGALVKQEQGYFFVASAQGNASGAYFTGIVLSSSGSPAARARVFYVGPEGHEEVAITNASGCVTVALARGPAVVTLEVDGHNYTLQPTAVAVVGVDLAARKAMLVFAAPQMPGLLYYRAYFYQSFVKSRTNLTYLGDYGPGIHEVQIAIVPDLPSVVLVLEPLTAPNGTGSLGNVTYTVTVPAVMARTLMRSALVEAASVFAEFFPLVGVFLVNDQFASLRSSGAIEFVLARPITKSQLLLSRYIGGLTAMLISSLVTSASLAAASWVVFNERVGPGGLGVVFAALLAALTGFYSLLYLVAVLTRRNFTVIAIVLYLLLYLFNVSAIASFITGRSWPLYMTPLSIASSVMDQYFRVQTLTQQISYTYAALSAALWAATPTVAALMIYRASAEA